MEPKSIRFIGLIFEGVEENLSEVKKDLEQRGIFPDKLTEQVLSKNKQIKKQNEIAANKKILELLKNADIDNISNEEYRIAANFRKKENISDEDFESIIKDKAKLKLLEQLSKKNECTGKSSGEKNS